MLYETVVGGAAIILVIIAFFRYALPRQLYRTRPHPPLTPREITAELRAVAAGWSSVRLDAPRQIAEIAADGDSMSTVRFATGRSWRLVFSRDGVRLLRLETVISPIGRRWDAHNWAGDIGMDPPEIGELDPLTLLEMEEPEAYKLLMAALMRAWRAEGVARL